MIRRLRVKFVCVNMAIALGMLCAIFATVLHFTRLSLASESLRAMLGLTAKVTLVAPKSIVRSEGKAVRVIDKRKI